MSLVADGPERKIYRGAEAQFADDRTSDLAHAHQPAPDGAGRVGDALSPVMSTLMPSRLSLWGAGQVMIDECSPICRSAMAFQSQSMPNPGSGEG
jgi:hypothetical protein